MGNDLYDDFFARSPQKMGSGPFFGENVQKSHRTGHFPLESSPKGGKIAQNRPLKSTKLLKLYFRLLHLATIGRAHWVLE